MSKNHLKEMIYAGIRAGICMDAYSKIFKEEKKMKKMLALLLAAVMVVSLAACGGNNATPSTTAAPAETQAPAETAAPAGDVYTGPDWAAIDAMDYDEASDVLYDWNLGEFWEHYQVAKEEVEDLDLRMALMAIAEAKLMESGSFIPVQTQGGNYALSRVVPRTISTVLWGIDEDRWNYAMVTNEIITAEDRNALIALWGEAADADAWRESAKAFLDEKGYTLNDTYNFLSSFELVTWDVIATSNQSDSYFIAPTYTPLLEYDAKNVQQPAAAESYEVSEDGLTYTFHIREGMKWVDQQGRVIDDVTADDWVASMQHLIDNNDGLGYLMTSTDGCGIKNYDAYMNGEITDFSEVGVKAVDDYTLVYTLEKPFPAFTTMMGYGCFAPLNRDFYKSQGGTFSTEGDEYTPGNYGTSPSTIAYCGAYLVTNFTAKNVTSYAANPEYWDPDAIISAKTNIYFNDGTDPLRPYTETKNGTVAGAGLNSSALELAKTEMPEGMDKTYFDLYCYIAAGNATTYCGWMNLHRGTWTNYNDTSVGVSPQTDADKLRTRDAMSNQNFRLALAMAFDRGAFQSVSVGEELKLTSIRNSYTPATFLKLNADVTVDINGTATTFPAGTYFGEIEQAQLNADGVPFQVWDPEGDGGAGSGDGFDGWYHPEEAVAFLDKAIEELGQIGVEVSAENPIYVDAPMQAYSEAGTKQLQAFKQSIEGVLGGKVIVNLVAFEDSTAASNAYYRINTGDEANYDIAPSSSGWGPDYGDAQSYLDTLQPYGYMTKSIGLY